MTMQNAIKNLRSAPDDTLIVLLLKQFKGLLEQEGVEMDSQAIHTIANQAAERKEQVEIGATVQQTLVNIVEESLNLLKDRFKLTFAKSLVYNGNLLTGWKTPMEFQDLIAQKNNAETRIAMGAALLTMLGDSSYIEYLFITLEHEYVRGHMEAMLAMRALSFAAQVEPGTEDWETAVRQKLQADT